MRTKSLWIAATLASAMVLSVGCDKRDEVETEVQAPVLTEEAIGEIPGAAAAVEAPPVVEEEEVVVAAIGQPAPAFTLTDEAGQEHDLTKYKGKIVVLEWTHPGCPYVERHYNEKTMVTSAQEAGEEVVWLAVDSTNSESYTDSKKWKEQYGFTHPVLLDPQGKVGKLYEAKTTPHMMVIDAEGTLRYRGAIDDDQKGEKKAAERTNYVLDVVNALKEGKEIATPETNPYGCSVKYAG